MKKNNNKGFTLAELLIVVAIIGVLIAIAMPTFGKQLEKARISADQANLRSAYADAVATYLSGEPSGNATIDASDNNKVNVTGVKFTHKDKNSVIFVSDMPFADSTGSTKTNETYLKEHNGDLTVSFTFSTSGGTTTFAASSGTPIS